MVARITTAAFQGIDVQPVDVQVHMASGLPSFTMVGLIKVILENAND
jgi:magnesium chelatase family protein